MRVRSMMWGLGAGLVAGATWWLTEAVLNWAVGGFVPARVAATFAGLDLGLGELAGDVVGGLGSRAGQVPRARSFALGLAAAYALCRIYDPPGLGTEAAFAVVAAALAALGAALAGPAGGPLVFVHLTLLTSATVALGGWALDELAGTRPFGAGLPFALAAVPLAAVLADRLLAVAVARRGARLGVELAAAALALVVWGRPITTAPIDDPLVTAVPPPAGSPDVILIVLDTTRADHLSTYGYARETSRHLSAFAADGLLFTQARSPAAWTLPGHASLFTGTYPTRHGAHFAGARLGGESRDGRPLVAFPLPPSAVTMAELLRDRGYPRGSLHYDHAVTHLPEAERQFIEANYDGEVAAMDEALGELLDALRARGRYQNALVVVTADHGEFLGEHEQMGHIGQMLYEPVLHVPLVVKFPGTDGPRGRSETAVQLVDVLPTVLAATGAAVPPGLQGEALPHVTHPSFAEEDIDPFLVARYGARYDRSIRVLYDGTYKLIRTSRGEGMLFDLARDPAELHDLAAAEPERAADLQRRLDTALGTLVARN